MTQHEKRTNRRDTLLVLHVQNQYKDIAHVIEKRWKKLHYVKNWFYSLTKSCWWIKNILNKAKGDLRSVCVFEFKSGASSCCSRLHTSSTSCGAVCNRKCFCLILLHCCFCYSHRTSSQWSCPASGADGRSLQRREALVQQLPSTGSPIHVKRQTFQNRLSAGLNGSSLLSDLHPVTTESV